MTDLSKPIERVTTRTYNVLYASKGKARPIVIRLDPRSNEDMLEFREKGIRSRFAFPVEALFKYVVRQHAFQAAATKRRDKLAARKARKEAA